MVTITIGARSLILARMERDELHHIAPERRAGLSLTRYSGEAGGGLIEAALGSQAAHINYLGAPQGA